MSQAKVELRDKTRAGDRVKLRQRGYKRSIAGLYRFLQKSGKMAVKLPNPKYVPKLGAFRRLYLNFGVWPLN